MSGKGYVGSFMLAKTRSKSIRQRHFTGNQFDKRKTFNFKPNQGMLHKHINARNGMGKFGLKSQMMGTDGYMHLPGDIRREPDYDYTFGTDGSDNAAGVSHVMRVDGVVSAWEKRGDLQLYKLQKKQNIFQCYRCGYPISSKLVAIKCDNWDWKMCYNCYVKVVNAGDTTDRD